MVATLPPNFIFLTSGGLHWFLGIPFVAALPIAYRWHELPCLQRRFSPTKRPELWLKTSVVLPVDLDGHPAPCLVSKFIDRARDVAASLVSKALALALALAPAHPARLAPFRTPAAVPHGYATPAVNALLVGHSGTASPCPLPCWSSSTASEISAVLCACPHLWPGSVVGWSTFADGFASPSHLLPSSFPPFFSCLSPVCSPSPCPPSPPGLPRRTPARFVALAVAGPLRFPTPSPSFRQLLHATSLRQPVSRLCAGPCQKQNAPPVFCPSRAGHLPMAGPLLTLPCSQRTSRQPHHACVPLSVGVGFRLARPGRAGGVNTLPRRGLSVDTEADPVRALLPTIAALSSQSVLHHRPTAPQANLVMVEFAYAT
eukprot:gene3558-4005_t